MALPLVHMYVEAGTATWTKTDCCGRQMDTPGEKPLCGRKDLFLYLITRKTVRVCPKQHA
eukprot:3053824-Rhodomonas_salina.2